MPYPDSEYPSILRGKDKREVKEVLDDAKNELIYLRHQLNVPSSETSEVIDRVIDTILKIEGGE